MNILRFLFINLSLYAMIYLFWFQYKMWKLTWTQLHVGSNHLILIVNTIWLAKRIRLFCIIYVAYVIIKLTLKSYQSAWCYIYLNFVHFKAILNVNSSYLLYFIAENQIIRNEFNSYNMGWNSLHFFINCFAVYKA